MTFPVGLKALPLLVIHMNKAELRQHNRDQIKTLSTDEMALFDAQISSYFATSQVFMPQSIIACYIPLKGEVSCRSIMQRLASQGHTLCLPVVVERNAPLAFREYRIGDELVRGKVGPFEPADDARNVIPDVLVIPMLGFNRKGNRLGYSTGFYDRTLEVLRKTKPIKAIGLGYSLLEANDVAFEAHDLPMDVIITEKEIINIK